MPSIGENVPTKEELAEAAGIIAGTHVRLPSGKVVSVKQIQSDYAGDRSRKKYGGRRKKPSKLAKRKTSSFAMGGRKRRKTAKKGFY
jgi:hypothetical protein